MDGFVARSGSQKYESKNQFTITQGHYGGDDSVVLKRPRRNISTNNLFDSLFDFDVPDDISQPNNISPVIDYYHHGGRLRPNEKAFDSLVLENAEDHEVLRRPSVESDCSGSAASVSSASSGPNSVVSSSSGEQPRSIKSYLRGYGWFVPTDR